MGGSRLLLYYPQWQGSGDADMILHGAAGLLDYVIKDSAMDFTSVDVATQEATAQDESHGRIRQNDALSRQTQQAVNIIAAQSPKSIFTLGGDCGIELAPVSHLNARYGEDMAVVWLDAHADLNTPFSSPSQTFHGMILRALMGGFGDGSESRDKCSAFVTTTVSKPLQPEQVILAGVRDLDPPEFEYISEQNIQMIKCEQLEQKAGESVVSYLRRRGFTKVYIHIDADVLGLDSFKSVMCPTPGGISIQTAKRVIKDIKEQDGIDIVGGSLVEVIKTDKDNIDTYKELVGIFTSLWQ